MIERWLFGWMDGWMERWLIEWMERWLIGWMERWLVERMNAIKEKEKYSERMGISERSKMKRK